MVRAIVAAFGVVLGLAAPAHAGSIVYSHGGDQMDLWVAGDDGRNARPLVGNVPLGMSRLREPAVSRDGRLVAFSGTTDRNASSVGGELHYGVWATGLYLWRGGRVRRVTPRPAPCAGCSSFETTPSLTPTGGTLTAETFFSRARAGNFGRLLARPPGGGDRKEFEAACDDTTLADPAAAPRGDLVAYVGCSDSVIVSGPGRAGERYVHTVTPRDGFAPETRSPAWSPDGARLAAIDRPGDETTEVWTFGADGSDPRLVLTAPTGVSLGTVAWQGAGTLLFDVAFDNGTDLWSVPATCVACEFPAGARRVTNDGVSRDPAWTPGAVSPFTVTALPARGALKLRVTLARAATVRFAIRGGRTVRRKLEAGTSTVRIAGVGRGRHRITARTPGEPARRVTARVR